jgi:hypothetical protein
MASSLAARIKDIFGVASQLVEGHNGIYEVSIDGRAIVTNQGKCSAMAPEDEILSAVRKSLSPLPGKEKMIRTIIPLMKA